MKKDIVITVTGVLIVLIGFKIIYESESWFGDGFGILISLGGVALLIFSGRGHSDSERYKMVTYFATCESCNFEETTESDSPSFATQVLEAYHKGSEGYNEDCEKLVVKPETPAEDLIMQEEILP